MNWGMRVLQTLALPLGYVTVWKKEQRLHKDPYISALCGFSYNKNYNTKNSVCKALKNADPCRYPKRLPARRERCRRNGHDFFVLQNVNSALSKLSSFLALYLLYRYIGGKEATVFALTIPYKISRAAPASS